MPYAELHCKSNFSFLEGASHGEELAARAAELGYSALAVTDRQSLAGIVRAHMGAKQHGVKLIVGAEVHPLDAPAAVLWASDRASYGRLARLLTVGRRRAAKGECQLTMDDIAAHADGLLVGVLPDKSATKSDTAVADPHVPLHSAHAAAFARQTPTLVSVPNLLRYREPFGDRAYLLAELFRGPDDQRRLQELFALSQASRLPLVAAGDVRYHSKARLPLHDVLTAIRLGTTVADAGGSLFPNAERHLRPSEEIVAAFASAPDAVARTGEVADRCSFSLDELRYEYPEELAPPGQTPIQYLTQLAWQGAAERYPRGVPDKVRGLIEHELRLIADLRYEAYFLTVWDLVRFARQRNILCQGRGSAANSAVCFCLGITSVDPERSDVLFERFVSRERNEAPDIDVDFEHQRREEVLQYLYDKYGRDRAGMTAVVITYRLRSAIRDIGKALGLSLDRVDALAKNIDGRHEPAPASADRIGLRAADAQARSNKQAQANGKPIRSAPTGLAARCQQAGLDPDSPLGGRFQHLVRELVGFPRHLSQHVGGMVMTQGPLCELAPIENAAMPGRTVIQWDKDDLDELGILKVDCLSLGMLTAIRKCLDLVRAHHNRDLTLATIPAEDPVVYDMISRADTMGVFQIESRAQISMLPRLRPRCFYDLVIEVAIVRPGPIQGQMVHPYLRRRNGEETPVYPNDAIREVLHKTLGVPLFQEQAMRLAVVAAGFTPGEADQLRRAMGAWRRPGIIEKFHHQLIQGMEVNGLTREFAEQVFTQIRGFGEYGFPESHAASFALLVYASAWLKCYYPAAFAAAILNSQPMGFYAPAQLIRDAREHDVPVRPVDVNFSDWDCTLEGSALRLGFRLVSGLPRAAIDHIVASRRAGSFVSLDDFSRRTGLTQALMSKLADADVFGSLERDRRAALWHALGQERRARPQPLFAALADDEPTAELPPMSAWQQVWADYRATGLSLKGHPLSFVRQPLNARRVTRAAELADVPSNRHVRVAGLVLLRQRPSTAKGITFVTLEDETGIANLVIKQTIWDHHYAVARHSPAWIAHGKVEKKDSVIHIVVNRLEDLAANLDQLAVTSRDFR